MKIQLAIDDLTLEEAITLVTVIEKEIDVIEIGTPLVYQEGMRAVTTMKKRFPKKEVLADLKIMDAGYYEAKMAFQAGADYVTVLGVTDDLTIEGCLRAGKEMGKQIVVDMICVKELEKRIERLETLGVSMLAVHVGTDQQAEGRRPIDDLKLMKRCCRLAEISVAGGLSLDTLSEYAQLQPQILIVGGGLTHAKNPRETAEGIRKKIKEWE